MADEAKTVTLSIMDKEYQVKCEPEEEANLRESAERVHESMETIRQQSNILGLDRLAVMAALNIASQLIKQTHENRQMTIGNDVQIDTLSTKLDQALTRFKPSAEKDPERSQD